MFNLQNLRTLRSLMPRFSLSILYAFCLGFFACWLACALWSFDSNDQSIIYMSTYKLFCSNMCGTSGAHTAALLFFLCGSAAYILVLLSAFVSYRFFAMKNFRKDFDAYIAYAFALASFAGMCNSWQVDPLNVQVPGGVLGYLVIQALNLVFDDMLSKIFLFVIFLTSVIIISRISFVVMGNYLLIGARLIARLLSYLLPVLQSFFYYLKKLSTRVIALFDGSYVEKNADSVVEFELGITYSHDDESEQFWNERFAKKSPQKETFSYSRAKEEKITPAAPSMVAVTEKKQLPYCAPAASLFSCKDASTQSGEQVKFNKNLANILEEKLERFGIQGTVTSIKVGPVITLFEYQPHIDSKISKIIALEDDLALALQAVSIRIIAPIPGKSVVGFEVANKHRRDVLFGKAVQSKEFQQTKQHLPLILGEDSIGSTVIVDLASMPHLLVAGSTGSGKSVALNSMLISLLCRFNPDDLKLILIDPKRLEFAAYADIPHLLVPIVTDPRKAAPVLRWVVSQMEDRYAHMEGCKVRNIFDYHALQQQNPSLKPMPFMVIVIDELSDLMMTAAKETEDLIARITQMARAAGIHMIVATQRPSVDVITGLIKVNFPSRISFRVTSKIDSRTILDCGGADKLLGKGDMLFLDTASRLHRAHGAYISEQERSQCIAHIRSQRAPEYIDIIEENPLSSADFFEEDTVLYQDVINYVNSLDEVSISLLQRKFRIGYNRSARIIDRLQSEGIIMQEPGGKTRKVIK